MTEYLINKPHAEQFRNVHINNYVFYISRQKSILNDRDREIAGMLTLDIPKLKINGSLISKVHIYFVSIGPPKKTYSIGDSETLYLDMVEADLSIWQMGLRESKTYLDITIWDEHYLQLYLYAGNKT